MIATTVVVVLLGWASLSFVRWGILDAVWTGASYQDCAGKGACWAFIHARFGQFMFGFYPIHQRWRVMLGFALIILTLVPLLNPDTKRKGLISLIFGFVLLFSTVGLMHGALIGLEVVETSQWGGLMLTLLLSLGAIYGSLPLGIVLALARRSKMPLLRLSATGFIELWRGVPLISVLFMASVMLPLFLPPGFSVDKLLRAAIGMTLFASAYTAEVIRGGLQAIPHSQNEASAALGLSRFQTISLVILPQALRIVIPGIVNSFIGMLKDTSLVLIIGMFDLLGMVQAASTDPDWLGASFEGYIFAGICYFLICYSMSKYSQSLEHRLQINTRKAFNS